MLKKKVVFSLKNILVLWGIIWFLVGCGGGSNDSEATAVAEAPTEQPTAVVEEPTDTPTPIIPIPSVGEPVISLPSPVLPGTQIGISVSVDGAAGSEITYEWSHPEGQGQIVRGQGTNGITYQVPSEAGTYSIGVKVSSGDSVVERSTFVTVADPPEDTPTPNDTPTPSVPDTPTLTETPIPAIITLNNIEDGDTVPCMTARGTYNEEEVTEEIWPVVFINNVWYPQDATFLPAAKVNGEWSQPVRFGNCDTDEHSGEEFQLFIIKAPDACHQQIVDYFEEGKLTNDFPGIPHNEVDQSCKDNISVSIYVTRE